MEGSSSNITQPMTSSNVVPLATDDPNNDPKKLRRILASRQYSRKYRMKQMQYIHELENAVKALQVQVEIQAPRIKYTDQQNCLFRLENQTIKQKLSLCSSELMFKEAQYEELQKEIDVLRNMHRVNQQVSEMFKRPGSGNQNNNYDPQSF